ncbi:MAG TPA: SpoIIE family protein phosphatase [Catenuloplanes sp.]|jgi:anti-sigma regulatory factor (Ser/Thr protein kinase)
MAVSDRLLDGGQWFRVEESSAASAVRRAAERLAAELGMPERRVSDLAIVAAELASNLVKHAVDGSLLLRPVRTGAPGAIEAGVELIGFDSGPGMADLSRSLGDGHSTTGTLGIGLGAIARQATWCDLHSVPGRGTVVAAQVWPGAAPAPGWAAGLARPLTGEPVSGDGFAVRVRDGRHQVLVCDGLGHGRLAAAAAQSAVHAFQDAPPGGPAAIVETLHGALAHTRGAAVAVAELDHRENTVRYAGLGNIAGAVFAAGVRRSMVSLPGIAGHQRRAIREYRYPLPPSAVVVLHSDGVVERWEAGDYPDLFDRSPQVIAATILRDAGVRRDDGCVVAARAWQ